VLKRLLLAIAIIVSWVSVYTGAVQAYTYTVDFTAGDVKNMLTDSLSNSEHIWGLWALVAYPDLANYSITGVSTNQDEWYTTHDSEFVDTNGACFRAVPGAEIPGNPPHPLHLISDQPDPLANYIMSYFGDTTVNVPNNTLFSFNFTSDSIWDGCWRLLVDGSRYDRQANGPALWDEDFWGGVDNGEPFWDTRDAGGGLAGNKGGYETCAPVPEPGSLLLMGTGLLALIGLYNVRRRAG